MEVVFESMVWEPNPSFCISLLLLLLLDLSVTCSSNSSRSSTLVDHGISSSFLLFPAEVPPSLVSRSLASVMEGLWSVFGGFELASRMPGANSHLSLLWIRSNVLRQSFSRRVFGFNADRREVLLGLMYPCFLGARMLGSTVFPCLTSGPSSLRAEDCLVYAFILMRHVLSIVAYDYQKIKVVNLITLCCLFLACAGHILPFLVRLRTIYVPNELRGGMIGLAFTPSNAAVLISLVQGGYSWNVGNAALMSLRLCLGN